MGRALGEEARIVEVLASIPPKIASLIEDRHLRRCLSYKEVKEEVEWEARSLQGYLQEYCGAGSLHGITTQ